MLYGTNGYTGRLIAQEAVSRGMRPVLAGRSSRSIEGLAHESGCPYRVFALDDADEVTRHLDGVSLVLNCAGPFSKTAPQFISACLRAKVHYLDITGEIDVIEGAAAQDARAREAGVAVVPAVGFDVVPSDCLALMLAERLPNATHLILAFTAGGEVSPGTAKTMLEIMPGGGRARIDGQICRVPADWKARTVPFPSGPREAVTIPWGDVASAYYSTGIANIETYLAASPAILRRSRWLRRFARVPFLRGLAQRWIERSITGPTPQQRAAAHAELWGQVSDADGRVAAAALVTADGYTLTVLAALAAVELVLAGRAPSGFSTPARAFGKEFVLSLPGTRLVE